MKIAYISTYLPKQCGIATFTNDLIQSIDHQDSAITQHVIALSDQPYSYPEEVVFQINTHQQLDYIQAAHFINENKYDCVVLEHEYGIFGGNSGVYILSLINQLHMPLLVNLHTILEKPNIDERAILIEIAKRASIIVVMSSYAIDLLQKIYHVHENKIRLIPHGVPAFDYKQDIAKEQLQLANKKIILTFGFIARNKGIETVIQALPKVVQEYPETIYLIVGKTHPNVLLESGEEYREYLIELIKEKGLEQHVLFVNDFVSTEALTTYLTACDIYITPYINEAQITSGTLSFAVGAGAAVLSTPYWHAKDLLADGRGILFDFKNYKELKNILIDLFDNTKKLEDLRIKARHHGEKTTWNKLGHSYTKLFQNLFLAPLSPDTKTKIDRLESFPKFRWDHLDRLTNHVGIIQHATFATPNYREGYCLDDNARALLVSLMQHDAFGEKATKKRISTYLSYIYYAQREDGLFHNFMNFQNEFLEETGSEDSFGRAIWALGYLFNTAPYNDFYQLGSLIFFKAVPHFENLKSIRAIAYTMMGISEYLKQQPNDERITELLRKLAFKLVHEYDASADEDWKWFEPVLAYDNAIIPLAILMSNKFLNDDKLKEIGFTTFYFLENIIMQNGFLSIIGNQKWAKQNQNMSKFGQQPIDVTATVLLFREVFEITKNDEYFEKMIRSFEWFLGENDLKLPLYDHHTKGCCDGLETYGINRNQGAESTLCYFISYITIYKELKIKLQVEE